MDDYNPQRRIYFMCGTLRDCLELYKGELSTLRKRCDWPNMDFIRATIYSFKNGPALEKEIPRLENCLKLWEDRKKRLEEQTA